MDKDEVHKKMKKMWDEVHLLNGLLKKMEKERLKILYYNMYHKDYIKKQVDLRNIDKRIQRAIDKRIELCNKVIDILGRGHKEKVAEGADHGEA